MRTQPRRRTRQHLCRFQYPPALLTSHHPNISNDRCSPTAAPRTASSSSYAVPAAALAASAWKSACKDFCSCPIAVISVSNPLSSHPAAFYSEARGPLVLVSFAGLAGLKRSLRSFVGANLRSKNWRMLGSSHGRRSWAPKLAAPAATVGSLQGGPMPQLGPVDYVPVVFTHTAPLQTGHAGCDGGHGQRFACCRIAGRTAGACRAGRRARPANLPRGSSPGLAERPEWPHLLPGPVPLVR